MNRFLRMVIIYIVFFTLLEMVRGCSSVDNIVSRDKMNYESDTILEHAPGVYVYRKW